MMDVRQPLDIYFSDLAKVVATRSTCMLQKQGAVLVKSGQLLTVGSNGVPEGLVSCLDIGCKRLKESIPQGAQLQLCRGVHAAQNAIISGAVQGVKISGATLYCTHLPCILCTKMLINAKIRRIVFDKDIQDTESLKMLEQAGIFVDQLCNLTF